jgi:hypothetical protein
MPGNRGGSMTVEETVKARRWAAMIGIIVGFSLEFFLIPVPHHPGTQGGHPIRAILTSDDFYYALIAPLAVWWWFAIFLRRRPRKSQELGVAFLIFGFYLSSALRAIAITVVRFLHLTT